MNLVENIIGMIADIVGDDRLVKNRDDNYIVSPENTEEVQKIIQLANQHKLQLFTSTCDDNFHWLHNITSGGVIIDFSKMKNILNIDRISRAVTIEPGITFIDLQNELKKHGLRAMNPIGLSAETSVLNCYVERAPLLSAPKPLLANGWQCILTMEVILPNGEILKTGASSLIGTKKPYYWPFGGGPDLSRLFTASQGTLGVVTKVTIKVKAIPESRKIFLLPYNNIEEFVSIIYKIQRIEIREECLVANRFNLSLLLGDDSLELGRLKDELPEWTLILCLAGPEEKIKYQELDLRDTGIDIKNQLLNAETITNIFLDEFLLPKRISKLLKYKAVCRKVSFYTTLDKISDLNNNMLNIIRKNNYPENELGIFITPIELGRSCFVEYYIFANNYDDKNLKKLYLELYELLVNFGANIDRPYGNIANIVYSKNPVLLNFLKLVKDQLDPNNIMNPGRLLTRGD